MKKSIRAILGVAVVFSLIVSTLIPSFLYATASSGKIVLTPEQFTIEPVYNCSVIDGNKVLSTNDMYPCFYVKFSHGYCAESVEIVLSVEGLGYNTATGMGFCNDNSSLFESGSYISYPIGDNKSHTFSVPSEHQTTELKKIRFAGVWSAKPESGGAASLTVEEIIINESKVVKAPQIVASNINYSSFDLSWELKEGQTAELYRSDSPLDKSNYKSSEKLTSGTVSQISLNELMQNTAYYFALAIEDNGKSGIGFATVTTLPENTDDFIEIADTEYTVEAVQNCTVDDKKVESAVSLSTDFDVIFNNDYYIKGIRITASVGGIAFTATADGIILLSGDTLVEKVGKYLSFDKNFAGSRYVNVSPEGSKAAVNRLRIKGEWFTYPAYYGEGKFTIEKIEIFGKKVFKAPEMNIANNTGTSLEISWSTEEKMDVELWYSENRLDSSNISSSEDKIKVQNRENNNAKIEGLTPRKEYFIVLVANNGVDTAYSCKSVIPQALDDNTFILSGSGYSLTAKANCSVKNNTVISSSNQYPQFNINLMTGYYIEEIKITATVTGTKNYSTGTGIELYSGNSRVATLGAWDTFKTNSSKTITLKLNETQRQKTVNRIYMPGFWSSAPSSGSSTITIDKIEIIGYMDISSLELSFDSVTKTSVTANWELPDNMGVELWYSKKEITESNFEELTDKTCAGIGRFSSLKVDNLETEKIYYFALKVYNGGKTLYSFGLAFTQGALYDFDKSLKLSDYTVKTRKDNNSFYFINGGYGCSASIVQTDEYSDSGNAFKMSWGDYKGYRWPILYFYSPNWADFSGKGFSITLAKTKNDSFNSIALNCRVILLVDGKGRYTNNTLFSPYLFPQQVTKHTVSFDYSDFFSENDSSQRLTPELSADITGIGFFFDVPKSAGKFDLYFDSLRIINPIKVIREVEEISFANDVVNLGEGGSYFQSASYSPYNATINDFAWSSSDPSVADVDPVTGNVVAFNSGTTKIRATAQNGLYTEYKVIVAQDTRGMQFRDLFTFDDGSIPEELVINGATPQIEYVRTNEQASLFLNSSKSFVADFSVNVGDLYGSGISLWCCGTNENKLKLELKTYNNKTYSYIMNIDTEDGFVSTVPFSEFKLNGTGPAPDIYALREFNLLRISYNGSLYIDSIKVSDPLTINEKISPQNTINAEGVTIVDDNQALKSFKYYVNLLNGGADYDYAVDSMLDVGLILESSEASVYSIYFVDGNYVQHDLDSNVTVNIAKPMNLAGMNNIWVLYFDGNMIRGMKADISDDSISFETALCGVYAIVAGTDASSIFKKIKSSEDIEIMISSGTEPQTVSKTIETVRKKNGTVIENEFPVIWIIIPIVLLIVVGGAITLMIVIKKRKKSVPKKEVK